MDSRAPAHKRRAACPSEVPTRRAVSDGDFSFSASEVTILPVTSPIITRLPSVFVLVLSVPLSGLCWSRCRWPHDAQDRSIHLLRVTYACRVPNHQEMTKFSPGMGYPPYSQPKLTS